MRLMKSTFLSCVFLFSVTTFAGVVPRNTAMFYEANYFKYLNKEIKLNVSAISPSIGKDKKLKKGYRFFMATTYDGKYFGGRIDLLMPSKMVETFVIRYGLIEERDEGKVSTKLLKAILKYSEDNGLYAIPKEASKSRPYPSEGEKNFSNDIIDIASSLSGKSKAAVIKYAKKLASGNGDGDNNDE